MKGRRPFLQVVVFFRLRLQGIDRQISVASAFADSGMTCAAADLIISRCENPAD